MAALTAFLYSRSITITTTSGGANIAGSLTDFPICVVVNSSSWATGPRGHFFSASNTAGKRVQFYSGATSLAYEVEFYDGTSAVYWVKVPTVTGNSTTVITVGYGNDPNGSAQDAATSVWDASYKTVMHLSDGTTLSVADSTSNANNGTNSNGAAAVGVADGGVSFDAATKRIAVVGGPSGSSARTIEGWVKTSSTGTGVMYDQGQVATGKRFLIYNAATNGPVKLEFNGSTGTGTATTIRNGAWHHFAGVLTGTTANSALLYIDGASDSLSFANGGNTLNTTATPLFLNSNVDGNTVGNIGTYDEFRISSVARTAGWLKASYFSLKTTSWPGDGWLTLGTEAAEVHSGSGTVAEAFAESATGRKGSAGSGSDSLTFTESALGRIGARGQASETFSLSESGAGRKAGYGSATDGASFAETASGTITLAGAGAEAGAFAESGVGRKQGRGAGSGAVTFSEAGSGDIFAAGQGSISSVFTESAAGVKQGQGSGSDAVTFSESAAGSGAPSGAGSLTVVFSETATGEQSSVVEEQHFGSTVVHIRRARQGSGSASVHLSLRATGRKHVAVEETIETRVAARGHGRKGQRAGVAVGASLTIVGSGQANTQGVATGASAFGATGQGQRSASGRSHLALVFSMDGSGVGIQFRGSGAKIGHGSGALAVVYSGAAEGAGDHVDENRQKTEDELLMVLAA